MVNINVLSFQLLGSSCCFSRTSSSPISISVSESVDKVSSGKSYANTFGETEHCSKVHSFLLRVDKKLCAKPIKLH